jgi:hypothetical protein
MDESIARALLTAAGVYLGAGLLFAAVFHARGIGRVDPAAARGSVGFRMLVTPGIATFWPLLALAWRRAARESA